MATQVLKLNHPYFGPGSARQSVQYPRRAVVEAQAAFEILAHAIRFRPGQQRVIGTLLGTRSEDMFEVEVKKAYVIPITENSDEVTLDIDYHGDMYNLLKKSNPELQIVGWYSTSMELNNMSALIHAFYAQENGTFPHPPVHLTVDPESAGINFAGHVSLPLWASPTNTINGNCFFAPIDTQVRFNEVDLPVLALAVERGGADVYGLPHSTDDAIDSTLKQIDEVLAKVREARSQAGSAEADALGRYVFHSVTSSPDLEPPSTAVPHKVQQQGGKFDPRAELYNAHLRDLMSVVNLTSSIKWQVQLNSEVSQNL